MNEIHAIPVGAFGRVRPLTHAMFASLAIATLTGACTERNADVTRIGAPRTGSEQAAPDARTPRTNASIQFNEVARTLVASHNTNAPMASRVYALVSVAQFEAASAVKSDAHDDRDDGDDQRDNGATIDAAIARASANVLSALYTDAASAAIIADALSVQHGGPRKGDQIGARVAQAVLTRAAADNSANANCPATPPLPASQFWHDDATPPNPQPLLPCFGRVRTWLGIDVTQFRTNPAAPPAFGSPAYLAGLAEVRQISDTRTAAQLAIVDAWLDGANTITPPGRWNLIASDLATRNRLSSAEAARVFAVLNITMMDTHIACWDRKYTYWEARPWMIDPQITTPRGQPHHPANPSGHACAGGAGSGALAGLFPAKGDSLRALGDEQGFSTVLSGVHFRFDVDAGLRIGRAIASRTLAVRDLNAFLIATQLAQ